MAIGTMTNVKHNLKEDPPGLGAPVRGRPDTHLPAADHQDDKSEAQTSGHAAESVKDKAGKHQSHGSCKSCGSLADKCSCENCQCQVCASKTGAAKEIEPPIKSATSATVVCGGSCIAAAQRATAGECPGCECPAGKCKCSKCHDKKTMEEAVLRVTVRPAESALAQPASAQCASPRGPSRCESSIF